MMVFQWQLENIDRVQNLEDVSGKHSFKLEASSLANMKTFLCFISLSMFVDLWLSQLSLADYTIKGCWTVNKGLSFEKQI